jgi:hypothetical protein
MSTCGIIKGNTRYQEDFVNVTLEPFKYQRGSKGNIKLKIERNWSDGTVNAYAKQPGDGTWIVAELTEHVFVGVVIAGAQNKIGWIFAAELTHNIAFGDSTWFHLYDRPALRHRDIFAIKQLSQLTTELTRTLKGDVGLDVNVMPHLGMVFFFYFGTLGAIGIFLHNSANTLFVLAKISLNLLPALTKPLPRTMLSS